MIQDVHPRSWIVDTDSEYFPGSGSRGHKSTGPRIPDPQHCFGEISITVLILGFLFTLLVRIRTGTALFYGGFSQFSSSLLLSEVFPQGAGPRLQHGTYGTLRQAR
jgi:hypothetical protein